MHNRFLYKEKESIPLDPSEMKLKILNAGLGPLTCRGSPHSEAKWQSARQALLGLVSEQ